MSLVSVAQWWSISRYCWGSGFDSRLERLRFFFRFCLSFTSNFPFPFSFPFLFLSLSLSLRPFVCAKKRIIHIYPIKKKGSKTKKRMKEEEIKKDGCGLPTRKALRFCRTFVGLEPSGT